MIIFLPSTTGFGALFRFDNLEIRVQAHAPGVLGVFEVVAFLKKIHVRSMTKSVIFGRRV